MKSLPSVRVSENTFENIDRAILKYNKGSLVKMSKQEFRRLALETLSQLILTDQLDLATKVVKGNS